jgi:hypothetical protein
MQTLRHLFSSGEFMPHGFCYLWNPSLVWLHLVSDTLISISYLSIPITLIYFIRKRRNLPFHWMFGCRNSRPILRNSHWRCWTS